MKKYTGHCHCGKVRYEAALDLSEPVMACNCSMCGRKGALLSFIPVEQFTLLSGEDCLTDYQFHKMRIHHLFCSTCGIHSFARGIRPDGKDMYAVNTRCLEDVDPATLTVKNFDGKNL